MKNSSATTLIGVFLVIGVIDLLRDAVFLLVVIGCFPFAVSFFLTSTAEVYTRIGVSPDLVQFIPTELATKADEADCIICALEIAEGQSVIRLKCVHS